MSKQKKTSQPTKEQKCKAIGCKGKTPKWQKIDNDWYCWHCGEVRKNGN